MLFFFLALLFVLGMVIVARNPKKHFLLFFVLFAYINFCFLGPFSTLQSGDYFKFGANYVDYFDTCISIYILGIGAFLLFYMKGYFSSKKIIASNKPFILNLNYRYYLVLYFVGISFIILRKASADSDLEYSGGWLNYLVFLADSLILGFVILIYEKRLKTWHIVLLSITIIYYLILGFRYRIILFVLGVIYHFYVVYNISIKTFFKWIFIGLITAYIINFISINREVFRNMEFENVTFESKAVDDLSGFDFFLTQVENYKTDMVVLKYMDKTKSDFDYGESMFMSTIYRVIPSSFFENNNKPIIPQQAIIRNSFGSNEGYYAGAAITNIISYYIAFGVVGVFVFMGLLGYIIGKISRSTNLNNSRDRVIVIIGIMCLFQEITRGFFPQTVTLLMFLLLTYKTFYKKV